MFSNTSATYAQSLAVLVRNMFSLTGFMFYVERCFFGGDFRSTRENTARKFIEPGRPWILRASTPFANINFIDPKSFYDSFLSITRARKLNRISSLLWNRENFSRLHPNVNYAMWKKKHQSKVNLFALWGQIYFPTKYWEEASSLQK